MYLQLRFVFFWRNDIGAKAARKMLVKLTTGVGKKGGKHTRSDVPVQTIKKGF